MSSTAKGWVIALTVIAAGPMIAVFALFIMWLSLMIGVELLALILGVMA